MTLNDLTIRLLFLFLPGIVCSLAVAHLTTHRDMRPVDHVIPSLIYGFTVYLAYNYVVASVWNRWACGLPYLPEYELLPAGPPPYPSVPAWVVGLQIVIALPVALVLSFARNHKWLNWTARTLKVTRKFGDRDVWSYVMNESGTPWVVIRDGERSLYFLGQVAAFSDEESTRELFLRYTRVHDNETGDEIYFAGDMYFSLPRDGIILEIPAKEIPVESTDPKEAD